MPPLLIPRTDIELLYKDVCKRPGGPQTRLDWAAEGDPADRLAAAFARSIEQLEDYDNRDEPFRDPQTKARTEANVDDARNTLSVALRLKKQGRLEAPEDDSAVYRYVEREVVAQRTTGGARFDDPRQELAGGVASSAMKVDLLLEADDGAPTVAEIKIREDKDPICALIQVLAAAALLSTEPQRDRLELHHGLRSDGRLDAVVLLVEFPDGGPMRQALDRAAAIATALLDDPRVNTHVRRIVAFRATADATEAGGPLTAEIAFRAEGAVAA